MNLRVNSEPRTSPPEHHHLYYPSPLTTSSWKPCCCCLFLLFSFFVLLVLAALLVIVLVTKPMKPHLDLRQLGLQYMATSPNPNRPGPSSANLYFIIRLVFAVVNTNNRVGISCGQSRVTLLYRGTPLGRATMPAFFQHPHTVKEVVATVGVDDVNLSNSDAADFTRDALLNDRVELRVLAHVATKIRLFNLQSPPLQVSLNCVIVISPRKQSLTYKQCGYEGLNV